MRYELMVGLRYTRARRRNRFVGVNSAVSMIGIALGVWALIVILSVMNGLQKEIRTRILGVASHVQVLGPQGRLANWAEVARLAAGQPHVLAAAPFVEAQAMLSAGRAVRPAMVRGIEPAQEERVADLARHMRNGTLDALRAGAFQVVLGADLARSLGLLPGDKVALIAPQGMVTPAGVIPRLKQFTVAGTFEAGIAEADGRLALVHLADAQALYRLGGNVSGVRLKLDDLFAARDVARELQAKLPPNATASDWTRSHAAFFHAVEVEKRVMFVILALIVLVAAINIVSTLVVAVSDRQSDIAILRTVGAAPSSVVRIFMVQGMVIGVIGTAVGLAAGVATALNIDVIVPAIENALRFKIFAKDVYLIPDLPSELQPWDVAAVTAMALLLSFLATLYPSWRASKVNPAEALRYE
jgi:lipoprotein-releasing system permease protein